MPAAPVSLHPVEEQLVFNLKIQPECEKIVGSSLAARSIRE